MKKRYLIGGTIALCTVAFSAITLAQSSGGEFTITKSTIDAGGGVSEGGDFKITGTIGQPDASLGVSEGGQFKLAGGFWGGGTGVVLENLIFKDSFETL